MGMRTIGRLGLGVITGLMLAGSAQADCVTAKVWQERVEKASPALQTVEASELSDDVKDTLAGIYNALPPEHDPILPHKVVQLISKSRKLGLPFPYVLFGFFDNEGCLLGMFQMPISTGGENG